MTVDLRDIKHYELNYNNRSSIIDFLNLSSKLAVDNGNKSDAFVGIALEIYAECIRAEYEDSLPEMLLTTYHLGKQKENIIHIFNTIVEDRQMLKELRTCKTLDDLADYCITTLKDYVSTEVALLVDDVKVSYSKDGDFSENMLDIMCEGNIDSKASIKNSILKELNISKLEDLVNDGYVVKLLTDKVEDVLFKTLVSYYIIPASYNRMLLQLEGISEKDLYKIYRFDAFSDDIIRLPEATRPDNLGGFRDVWIKGQEEMSADGKLSIDTLLSAEYCQLCISSSISIEQLDTLVYGFKDNERDSAIRKHLSTLVEVLEDVNLQTLYTYKEYMDRLSEDATKYLFDNMDELKGKIKLLAQNKDKEAIDGLLNEIMINCVDLDKMVDVVANTLNRVTQNTKGVSSMLADNVSANMKYCSKPKQIRKFGIVISNHLFNLAKFSEKETFIVFIDLVEYLSKTILHNVKECFINTQEQEIVETVIKETKFTGYQMKAYTELNKLAKKAGYDKVRQKGDHGIFKKLDGSVVVIPQGRVIGKGLNIKIQKDIERQ